MDNDDMKAFLLVVRRALLMICAWIENRYNLRSHLNTMTAERLCYNNKYRPPHPCARQKQR